MKMGGIGWYLCVQTVILEITWFIMLWWGIHQGGFGIWCAWFVCTLLVVFSSVCSVAWMTGEFDPPEDKPKRATNGDYLP